MDMPNIGDDYNLPLPEAEPFPELVQPAAADANVLRLSPEAPEPEPSSEAAEAPFQRRRRVQKVLERDLTQELRNSDLAAWTDEYLANMEGTARSKQHYKLLGQAKKNAAFWVKGVGIGGVGSGLGTSKMNTPLDMFSGETLIATLTGVDISGVGRKRSRSAGEEGPGSESEGRRIRPREDDGEHIGRGDDFALGEGGVSGFDDVSLICACSWDQSNRFLGN